MITFTLVTVAARVLFGKIDGMRRHFKPSYDDTWFVLDALERLRTEKISSFRVRDIAKSVKSAGYRKMSLEDIEDTCSYHVTLGDIRRTGDREPCYAITEKGLNYLHLK